MFSGSVGSRIVGVHYRPIPTESAGIFKRGFEDYLRERRPFLVVGDFNMPFVPGQSHWLTSLMSRYELDLLNCVVQTTNANTVLDLAYGVDFGGVSASVLESPFSFHRPIGCYIKREEEPE